MKFKKIFILLFLLVFFLGCQERGKPLNDANLPDVNTTLSAITSLNISRYFNDVDNLTFTANGLPVSLEMSTAGVITGTATTAGSYEVEITATDTDGQSVSDTFTWSIALENAILKTGQTTQYKVYDDAYYGRGLERSYTRDTTKKVVRDNATGLMWQDDNNATSIKKNHADSMTYCTNLTLGGFSTWRLPSIEELVYLTDKGRKNSSIDSIFQNIISHYYWSSSTFSSNINDAWVVNFHDGSDINYDKSSNLYLRCVRKIGRDNKKSRSIR